MTTTSGPEKAPETPKTTTEVKKDLDQIERKTGGTGAVPNTPKATLLDATSVQAKMPDKRIRWVNIADASKVTGRVTEGYERVPESEGGRQVGNLALFRVPAEIHARKVRAIEEQNERRLNAHKAAVEQVAESVERTLRDKHGIRAKILIEEKQ